MNKRSIIWLRISTVFQLITAGLHSLSFVNSPQPQNDSEKQLIDLMSNYHMELGNGFTPTMENIMTSFSISFVLLLLFGAIINLFLAKRLDAAAFRGLVLINVLIFGACFVTMLMLTFLPPIMCLGVITLSLLLTLIFAKPEAGK